MHRRFWKRRWRRRNVILLLERLDLYVRAGLSIDAALRLCDRAEKKRSAGLGYLLAHVQKGGQLSSGLAKHLGVGATTAALVAHGESSGGLDRALSASRALLEREDELSKKCLSALTYPLMIGLMAAALTIGLIRGVMPEIMPMLRSLHVELPLLTRVVMAISDQILIHGLAGAAIGSALVVFSVLAYRKWLSYRRLAQSTVMRVPLVGSLATKYSAAVFLQSCGSLVDAGLPVSKAYERAVATIGLIPLRDRLLPKTESLMRGMPLGEVLGGAHLPAFVSSLAQAGEVSGTLGPSLLRAAAILDRDIEHALKRLTALIEPLLMAGMGAVVGAIALSIMMPIYDISKVLQK